MFRTRVQKIEEVTKKESPKLLKSKGKVEQYPDWDEEDGEEDEDE